MNPIPITDGRSSLPKAFKDLDHKIESLVEERNGLKISLRNSKDECASLRRQLRAKTLQPANKHKQLAKCNALIDELRNKNSALQKDKAELADRLRKSRDECASMWQSLHALEAATDAANIQVQELEAKLARRNALISDLMMEARGLK